ncbi:hypothetical protein [Streptomyces sp. NPDC003393]
MELLDGRKRLECESSGSARVVVLAVREDLGHVCLRLDAIGR